MAIPELRRSGGGVVCSITSLATLVRQGKITRKLAEARSSTPEELGRLLGDPVAAAGEEVDEGLDAGGDGGAGCVAFRREAHVPRGGPDGGDGGHGGSIYALADRNINTLIDYRYARRHEARNGEAGRGSDQFGHAADDIILRMPVGTIIRNFETGEVMMELLEHGEQRMLAKGGDGGFGNMQIGRAHV